MLLVRPWRLLFSPVASSSFRQEFSWERVPFAFESVGSSVGQRERVRAYCPVDLVKCSSYRPAVVVLVVCVPICTDRPMRFWCVAGQSLLTARFRSARYVASECPISLAGFYANASGSDCLRWAWSSAHVRCPASGWRWPFRDGIDRWTETLGDASLHFETTVVRWTPGTVWRTFRFSRYGIRWVLCTAWCLIRPCQGVRRQRCGLVPNCPVAFSTTTRRRTACNHFCRPKTAANWCPRMVWYHCYVTALCWAAFSAVAGLWALVSRNPSIDGLRARAYSWRLQGVVALATTKSSCLCVSSAYWEVNGKVFFWLVFNSFCMFLGGKSITYLIRINDILEMGNFIHEFHEKLNLLRFWCLCSDTDYTKKTNTTKTRVFGLLNMCMNVIR